MRITQLTALSALFTICLGCDGMAADQGRTHPWARVATEAQIAQALVDLNAIVDSGIAAFGGASGPLQDYQFIPAAALDSSRQQRILILEGSIGMPRSAIGRYKNRLLAIYDFPDMQTPIYQEQFPITRQSILLNQVGDYISKLPYHVPTQNFSAIYRRLRTSNNLQSEIVLNVPTIGMQSHAFTTFETLAELNPEAQFVLASSAGVVVDQLKRFCGFHDDAVFAQAKAMNSRIALQISTIIERFDINYINSSECRNYDFFAWQYELFCQGRPDYKPLASIPSARVSEYLSLQVDLLKKITQTFPRVAVFKSLPNNETKINFRIRDKDFEPETLSPMAGLFRVGYFSTPDFDATREASEDIQILPPEQQLLNTAADIYVNGGFEEIEDDEAEAPALPDTALRKSYVGLHFGHHRTMSTSLAAPLALSFANRLRLDGKWSTPGELHTLLKPHANPRQFDPIKQRLLELYPLDQH